MNAIRSNNVSLKYQRFTSKGYRDIGVTKTEFVAKTQFLRSLTLMVRVQGEFFSYLKKLTQGAVETPPPLSCDWLKFNHIFNTVKQHT